MEKYGIRRNRGGMGALTMSKRVYNFSLPYELSGMQVHVGLSQLKDAGVFDRLPVDFRAKLEQASVNWEHVSITKEMCDSIDDDTWQMLAQKLGLDWNLA
jgi:hypothetical protein